MTIETHILDGHYDLYDQRVRLAFVKWLRPELIRRTGTPPRANRPGLQRRDRTLQQMGL